MVVLSYPTIAILLKNVSTSLVPRLQHTGLVGLYDVEIFKLLQDGYAEPVPEEELLRSDGAVWYFPHRQVVTPAKPDRVKIPLKDRDALRFLWRQGDQQSIQVYRMTSHLFGGVWCASSSTYALRKAVSDLSDNLPKQAVFNHMYVDDLLASLKNVSTAEELIKLTRQALKVKGFTLTKFVSNCTDVLNCSVPEEDRALAVGDAGTNLMSKALGIRWNVSRDIFLYSAEQVHTDSNVTKRSMLSQLASAYDPLGLIAPIIIQGKILFQNSTKLKLSWDEKVPHHISVQWKNWLNTLSLLSELQFQRCVCPGGDEAVAEIHVFSDGSESGYGACCYIRVIDKQGIIHVSLVASKNRLAPVKQVTIPRLELCGAVLGAKLCDVVRRR